MRYKRKILKILFIIILALFNFNLLYGFNPENNISNNVFDKKIIKDNLINNFILDQVKDFKIDFRFENGKEPIINKDNNLINSNLNELNLNELQQKINSQNLTSINDLKGLFIKINDFIKSNFKIDFLSILKYFFGFLIKILEIFVGFFKGFLSFLIGMLN